MANYNSRMSIYSNMSAPRSNNGISSQVSVTTLLNALHTAYTSGQPYYLESSTSLVVNTWITASNVGPDGRYGGTVDVELGRKAWEHARRRAEDGCIVLGSLHPSTPSQLAPFVSALPLTVPTSFYTALDVLKAFTHCVTPLNHSYARHSALSGNFSMDLSGAITGASIALSTTGIDTKKGLLRVPSEPGFRAFDVFYYLNSPSASPQEREILGLKSASEYALLSKSGTYNVPSYVPTADDAAASEDFRENLKAIGIRGRSLRDLIAALAGILKLGDTVGFLVDSDVLEDVCNDVAALLNMDPLILLRKCDTTDREVLIAGLYEALVDWVITKANESIRLELKGIKLGSSDNSDAGPPTPDTESENGDTVSITVVEIPNQALGKAISLRNIFDDSQGINAELKEDGVEFTPAGSSVIREMQSAISESEPDLGIMSNAAGREHEHDRERREAVLEKVAYDMEDDCFLKGVLFPIDGQGIVLGKLGRFDLSTVLGSSRVWFQLALHPTDDVPSALSQGASGSWSAGAVSAQLRSWRLPEWANRRNKQLDFTADFDITEFVERYSRLGCQDGREGIENWILERGWSNGEVIVGTERIWIRETAWWEAESMLDLKPMDDASPATMLGGMIGAGGMDNSYLGAGPFATPQASRDDLLEPQHSSANLAGRQSVFGAQSIAPTLAPTIKGNTPGDYGLGHKGDENKGVSYYPGFDPETGEHRVVTEQPISKTRKIWVFVVWAFTFWIPSPVLKLVGRMKRPDVRMAWREKLVLCLLIFLLNATIIFYIVFFGKLLCPNKDKVWNRQEVSYHQGDDDFYVSHRGKVYDISDFWRKQHSDTHIETTTENMQPFAGADMDPYIIPPLTLACPGLVTDNQITLISNTTTGNTQGIHKSGNMTSDRTSKLASQTWYSENFLPKMKEYYKGPLVTEKSKIESEGKNQNHYWFIYDGQVFDLTDYFHTLDLMDDNPYYTFVYDNVAQLIKDNAGQDITEDWNNQFNSTTSGVHLQCFKNLFYIGETDFRKTARCQVNDYLLLAFTIILCTVILVKFLAALQLGSKRRPAAQDKFVICQVPAYTEGEDQLRKGLDSLTALAYDNKRKLICVICDGMIVGGGNDRPTPKIVLDILGVDPKVDPPALPFKSVGQGSEQLNYGKVYSGLYEYEGNVVPYIVVVKVGKESEQRKAKPGNRGKRDSQILLMSFLNRVHHRAPMSPLELEMFHQINNIIGVDPELYEYLFMVDADTMVKEDSLNRLVASCANDAKIAGICGETSLENEERTWWTMIQVYEYYISHHLAKAFESLFGSVTCLPGCFCMYRLRTADKGRPLIISDKVINEYSDCDVDTLHKKNLLSLGEDRYLTTLMTKHFPGHSYKFIPDAYAKTAAPETWSILLSQRRRWINSTIHNLGELIFLKDMCGFCCFSMRFVVFIDLFGTIILPATCGYIVYLIYTVATGKGQLPIFSIVMLAAVYGLQAIIFIVKRQWQHVGWMIIYILAFPIYSFALPVYSFWKQDDFSWGNTRIVIGEQGNKQVIAVDDEGFDPRSIPLQRWDDYATANNLPGRRGLVATAEKGAQSTYDDDGFEMNDMQSVYSSVQPASTILGFNNHNSMHMPPQSHSPNPFGMQQRQSSYTLNRYQDNPQNERHMSMGNMSDVYAQNSPYAHHRPSQIGFQSSDNLMGRPGMGSRPASNLNFQSMTSGPSDAQIIEAIQACLGEVDLDTVTKKQLKALAEQRLQTQLNGERKTFLDHQIDAELANM
ncbi:hypothetical protein EJ05DRAFT_448546 [Pseudovirgaria hyperparasitica]|uniref:chitin synthase n=1 Tax=Pseudovirgaria hyperparasitica TaxID=470096 RepID=A0A6A6WJU1_9PEZI|nr:uncharacterized protein EJ05DRAFT_448546 [Pseudovirgaria hyperparasitica]KAF2762157.1 hypothetical protein EJ05DRAFT_448546 [Pseudovirgaria hyperparasitica]